MADYCCYHCKFYHPYYTKGRVNFIRQDLGLCGNQKKTVDKRCDACENFTYKYYSRINYKNVALKALAESLNNVAEIKQILEEDNSEALEQLSLLGRRQKERAQKERERKK